MSDISYHTLLNIKPGINAADYRTKFQPTTKNSAGIPLHLEDEAEKRGKILANSYEALYDDNKEQLKANGIPFSHMAISDEGQPIAINYASILSVPPLVDALEQGDNPLWAVLSLHSCLADEETVWVFSHLCEALHSFENVAAIRNQFGEDVADKFDDMKMYLVEALYQFDHRHC